MKDTRYFFSYSRVDEEFVLKLATELRAIGVNIWLDQLDILAGERWDRSIERALANCQGLIGVLSPESLASDNVMDELSYALEEGKLVVPILLRPCAIPLRLRRVHYADFSKGERPGFVQLLRALRVSPPPQQNPLSKESMTQEPALVETDKSPANEAPILSEKKFLKESTRALQPAIAATPEEADADQGIETPPEQSRKVQESLAPIILNPPAIRKEPGSKLPFIPCCPSCAKFLLQRRETAPFVPQGDAAVDVKCAHCATTSKIYLADLLIWKRTARSQAIVWRQAAELDAPQKGYPPEPKIAGNELVFEWDIALVAGKKDFRFLKIRLPGYTAELRSVNELFYSKLLVPGRLIADHCCVPFQLDWLDAAQELDILESEVRVPSKEIIFRRLRVCGWPTEITKVFAGDLGLQVEPNLSVGLFPDPETVCGEWRWFRVFLAGHHREGYGLRVEGGEPILPTLTESLSGCPDAVAVVRRSAAGLGATFRVRRRGDKDGRDGLAYLGIDFGTSNTLVYFAAADQVVDAVRPERNAVYPAKLASTVKWLAGDGEGQVGTIAEFLPKAAEAVGRTDQYLIPSALWQLDGRNFIRWNSDAPTADARALAWFKWDRKGVADYTRERRSFFQELLLVSLPYVLRELRLSRLESIEVKVGIAFPLAFGVAAPAEDGPPA